ncbi:MAG: signal recognition particle receptor subunit alpha, partial [Gemmatimonadales bacterium]|nr:signal recognition particle receptor subunit alpha [Gemmatimonadales bacterium]
MARLGEKLGLWQRIKRLALTDVGALARGLNADDLEQMERVLIEADFGVPATLELVAFLEGEVRKGKLKTDVQLREAVVTQLGAMLAGPSDPARLDSPASGPTVVLVVGVNGVGKTTSVAKLARRLQREGKKVLLGAADTYRAGAVAQLETWAARLGIECVSGASGGDPAAVAYDAVEAAIARNVDVVVIDT